MENAVTPSGTEACARPSRCDTLRKHSLVITIVAAIFAANATWIALDRRAFSYDDAWYTETSLRLLDAWSAGGLPAAFDFFIHKTFMGNKPPLIILLPQPLLLIFGRHDVIFPLCDALCLVAASAYLAAIVSRLLNRDAAAMAVLAFSLMPLTAYVSRIFFVEILLATIVLMFIHHLMASEHFARRGHTLLVGLAFGLGMLAKLTFPVFVAGMLLVEIVEIIRGRRTGVAWLGWVLVGCIGPGLAVGAHVRGIAWGVPAGLVASVLFLVLAAGWRGGWRANLHAATGLALWVTLVWYLPNGKTAWEFLKANSVGAIAQDYTTSIANYWLSNVNVGFGVVFCISLVIALDLALISVLFRTRHGGHAGMGRCLVLCAAWMLPPLLLFTLGTNRTTRFILPILPAAALLYAALLSVVARRSRAMARIAAAAHTCFAAYAYAVLSFGGHTERTGPRDMFLVWGPELTERGPLSRQGEPIHRIVEEAWRIALQVKQREALAMLLTDNVRTNQNTLLYYAAKLRLPLLFGAVPYGAAVTYDDALAALNRADLLVYQQGGDRRQYPHFTNRWGPELLGAIQRGELPEWRPLDAPTVPLNDGSIVRFIERIAPSDATVGTAGKATSSLTPCLVLFNGGTLALTGYAIRLQPDGMQMTTCWTKLAPDAGRYAIAAHIVNSDSSYSKNADHVPEGGAARFAPMRVGESLLASHAEHGTDWHGRADRVAVALFDVASQRNAACVVIYGFTPAADGWFAIPLPRS